MPREGGIADGNGKMNGQDVILRRLLVAPAGKI
jgi:hypothetical protein